MLKIVSFYMGPWDSYTSETENLSGEKWCHSIFNVFQKVTNYRRQRNLRFSVGAAPKITLGILGVGH